MIKFWITRHCCLSITTDTGGKLVNNSASLHVLLVPFLNWVTLLLKLVKLCSVNTLDFIFSFFVQPVFNLLKPSNELLFLHRSHKIVVLVSKLVSHLIYIGFNSVLPVLRFFHDSVLQRHLKLLFDSFLHICW
uniref:Uncharacterized protein n=1 Tax=Opuntia streptacantha TaxID=393608 RepID=A0A7C8ZMB9_OPUST